MAYHCHACGHEQTLEVKVGRRDCCENCGADLHCCLNCRFYEANGDYCRENVANFVSDREKSNFCSAFTYQDTKSDKAETVQDAKSKLDALFKGL